MVLGNFVPAASKSSTRPCAATALGIPPLVATWLRRTNSPLTSRVPAVASFLRFELKAPPREGVKICCASSGEPAPATGDEIRERFRLRVRRELTQMAVKAGHHEESFSQNLMQLDSLIGKFSPDLNSMRESEWVDFVADASSIARKMVILKTVFPSLSIPQVVSKKPRLFLQPEDELRNIAEQVSRLLDDAEDPGSILSDTPDLFDPAMVVSVLVTFQRWFPKDDPVKKLQTDGAGILRRAQDNDIPLDPVYFDGNTWKAPAFDTQAQQLPWQDYIRTKVNKLPPLSSFKNSGRFRAE